MCVPVFAAAVLSRDTLWLILVCSSQACSGLNITGRVCPTGMAQFPEPAAGISGYYAQECSPPNDPSRPTGCDGLAGFKYSIVDHVVVPTTIAAGEYLLSWRWDCEVRRHSARSPTCRLPAQQCCDLRGDVAAAIQANMAKLCGSAD